MKTYLKLTLLLLALLLPVSAAAADGGVVNVYNWGQYISDGSDDYIDVNAAFTEATGIKVNYMTYDSNESLYTKLKTGGSSYDVIFPSDYMTMRMISENMLLPLNFDNIPNVEYIDDAYRNTIYDPENKYSVPYTWGTTGIIYNRDFVDEEDTGSWDILWNEKYAGKILMFDNPRDAFAVTEAMLGYSMNTSDEDELRAAAYKLMEQKPLVQSYVMDQIYDKMQRGEAWVAPYYAGDYMMMVEENPSLEYYVPREPYNFFIDTICIPVNASHKEEAEAYINFLLDPEICSQNMDYLGYSVPESAAKEFLDEELAASPIAYPDEETLSRGVQYTFLEPQTMQLMDALWLTVKTEGRPDLSPAIGICATILLVGGFLIWRSARDRRRKANRCLKWRAQN